MAGVTVTGVDAVVKELSGVGDRMRNLRPVMRVASEDMRSFVSDRFTREEDPEGQRWQDLAPATRFRPGRGGASAKILSDSRRLHNSAFGTAEVDGFEFGLSAEYAGDHHFGKGAPERRILPIDGALQPTTAGPGGRLWSDIRDMVDRFIRTGRVI